jgi:hypothetical protein
MKMYRRAAQLTHSSDGVPDVVLQMRSLLFTFESLACDARERKATGAVRLFVLPESRVRE